MSEKNKIQNYIYKFELLNNKNPSIGQKLF